MKRKTILYLRTDLGNQQLNAGGSVGHTLGVLRAYQQMGYTTIVASSALWPVLEKELLQWVPLKLPFFCRWLGTKISAFLSTFFFAPRIIYLIIKYKPSYIYQRYSVLNFSGIMARFACRVPVVLEYNGSEIWIERFWTFKQTLRLVRLIGVIEWLNIRYAQLIVVVSHVLQQDLIKRGVDAAKIVVNPNGVDVQQFDPSYLHDNRHHIRALFKIESQVVVGFIGTFSAWHGINILAKIIPQVLQQNPALHFLLIGDGQLHAWLKKELCMYDQHITFTGTVAQEQAKNYLAACDMFLCPTQPNADGSPFFGSPTKLFEYMSLAKPIIASAIEQVEFILNPAYKVQRNSHTIMPQSCGLLVDPHDVMGFVYAINLVAQWSTSERAVIGDCARNKVIQEYTWTQHVAKITMHPTLS